MSTEAITAMLGHELTSDEFRLLFHLIEASAGGSHEMRIEEPSQAFLRAGFTENQSIRILCGLEHGGIIESESAYLGKWQPGTHWRVRGMSSPDPVFNDRWPDKKIVPKGKPGYIYVVHAVGTEWYKIGITSDIERRAQQLGAKAPFEIQVIIGIHVTNNVQLERLLHEEFSQKRTNGEWFVLDDDDLAQIENIANDWKSK